MLRIRKIARVILNPVVGGHPRPCKLFHIFRQRLVFGYVPETLEKHVSPDRLFRKSGDWDVSFSDSVLVCDDGWRNYILAAQIEDKDGERILRDLVPAIEALLKPSDIEARSRQQTTAPRRPAMSLN